MLRAKTQQGERYTMQDALQSLLLDQLRDAGHSRLPLARWWGWSRSQLFERWTEIEVQPERQRTFYSAERKAKTRSGSTGESPGHSPNTDRIPNRRNQRAIKSTHFSTHIGW